MALLTTYRWKWNYTTIHTLYERKMQHSQVSDICRDKPLDPPPLQGPKFAKQLIKFEMEERHLRGLYFNCDEAFTRGHHC